MITFTDVALEKLYIFGRSLNKKLPKRDHPDLHDVQESVDLDSFRVTKIHENLPLPLEPKDSEVEGIGSDVATIRDPEQDFLSNIIGALNDAHQTDFTTEDKVDIATIHQKVHENEELRQVIEGDNSESNKWYKFEQVPERVDLFVDESGQDTKGKLFVVAVVAVRNSDNSRQHCESFEKSSGKGKVKWRSAQRGRRLAYLRTVVSDASSLGITMFYSVFRRTIDYDSATIDGIAKAIRRLCTPGVHVYVHVHLPPFFL